MRELIALCGDVPVGLVPGGEDAYINEEERQMCIRDSMIFLEI